MSEPSWGIVMTVREPAQLVLANVHTHLAQGAAQVHVFLDDPDDPVGALLDQIDGCVVTRCDKDHWRLLNRGRRPVQQTRRQTMNATLAYRQSPVDWLIHLDADEFLFQRKPLSAELARTPRAPGFLVLPVRERVFDRAGQDDLFEGAFRVPARGQDDRMRQVFGSLSEFMMQGVTGHSAGKACVPVGRDLQIRIHVPRTASGNKLPMLVSDSTRLLHFDGLTRLHWIVKMLRYAKGPTQGMLGEHRAAQLEAVRSCRSMAQLVEFHDRIKAVDQEQAGYLRRLGLLEFLPFALPEPATAAARSAAMSFSAADFDADLRARNADLLADLA